MAAEHELQFTQLGFNYMLGDGVSNVNINFHNLINCKFQNMPHLNAGYEALFSQNKREHGNKGNFVAAKRDGFIRSLQAISYEFKDMTVFKGKRYAIGVNGSESLKTIWHKCDSGINDGCNQLVGDCCDGSNESWTEITRNGENQIVLRIIPCQEHKFIRSIGGIGGDGSITYRGVIANVMEGNVIKSVFWIEDTNGNKISITTIPPGRRIEIVDATDNNVVTGQAMQAGNYDATNQWIEMGSGFWLGIGKEFELGQTEIFQKYVMFKTYEDFGEVLTVTDGNGLIQINSHTCEEYSSMVTVMPQTKMVNGYITSATNYDGLGVAYLTSTGYLNVMRAGGTVGQSLGGTIHQTIYVGKEYDRILQIQDYLIMIGPNSTKIGYKTGLSAQGDAQRRVDMLMQDTGYFSRGSALSVDNNLYLVTQYNNYEAVIIKPRDNGLGVVKFEVDRNQMSRHWVNSDFMMMDRNRGDEINLFHTGYEVLVFMTDNSFIDFERPKNTKILLYNMSFKFWHKRMICGIDIKGYNEGCWYGDNVYCNAGATDNGNPIKQIISANFGETSSFTPKEMAMVKIGLGYGSSITKDTILKVTADSGGYNGVQKWNTLGNTKYIKWINYLKHSGLTNEDMIEKYFEGMPTGIGMYSGNGVGLGEPITKNMNNEFEQFCDYETGTIEGNQCSCLSEIGCDVHSKKDGQDFYSDVHEQYYRVSKYGVIKLNLGLQAHNFHIELIANNEDGLEFFGYFLVWKFMDNALEYLENTIDYPTTPEISKLSGKYLPKH